MKASRHQVRGARATAIFVVFALAGCRGDSIGGVTLVNDTPDQVRITEIVAGVEGASPSQLDAGHDSLAAGELATLVLDSAGSSRCTSGEIVARTLDGREVARLLPPVCAADTYALSWAIDPALARLLPGTINAKPTRRYTLLAATAQAGATDCAPCRVFTTKEIEQLASGLDVTSSALTLGLMEWTSTVGDESLLVRVIHAPTAQKDPLSTWIGIAKNEQPATTVTLATVEGKQITVLVDRTRTGWAGNSYAYVGNGTLFLVSYSSTTAAATPSSPPPGMVERVLGMLP